MKAVEAEKLRSRFGFAIVQETEFLGEYTFEIIKEHLKEVLIHLKELPNPGYEVLMDLTGVDYLHPHPRTKVVYWLHNPTNYERVRITTMIGREEALLPTVIDLWEGANWYERELYDLFGVKFEGHPDLKRILMPDDWKGYPLRKDYALTEESVEFKHAAKPKIPSKIIHVKKEQKLIEEDI